MKKRNFFLPDFDLIANFRKKSSDLSRPNGSEIELSEPTSFATAGSSTRSTSQSGTTLPQPLPNPSISFNNSLNLQQPAIFIENQVYGPGGRVRSKPINSDNPDKAIFMFSVPKTVDTGLEMKLSVSIDGSQADTLKIERINGNYITLRNSNRFGIRTEATGASGPNFFTISDASEGFITFLDQGVATEVIKITYQRETTFDDFQLSFIIKR